MLPAEVVTVVLLLLVQVVEHTCITSAAEMDVQKSAVFYINPTSCSSYRRLSRLAGGCCSMPCCVTFRNNMSRIILVPAMLRKLFTVGVYPHPNCERLSDSIQARTASVLLPLCSPSSSMQKLWNRAQDINTSLDSWSKVCKGACRMRHLFVRADQTTSWYGFSIN